MPKPHYTTEQVTQLLKQYFPKLEIDKSDSRFDEDAQYFYVMTKPTQSLWKLELESTSCGSEPVIANIWRDLIVTDDASSAEGIEECLRSACSSASLTLREHFEELI